MGETFVNVTPLTSAETRGEEKREKKKERNEEEKKRTTVRYTRTVYTRILHVRYRAFQRGPLKYGIRWTKRDPLTLSLSLSVPRDLLITLESECSLALRLRPEGERAKHRVCATQPLGNSQQRRRPDVIYTARLVHPLFFRGNRLLPWEINRRFSFFFSIQVAVVAAAAAAATRCYRTVVAFTMAAFVSGHCRYLPVKLAIRVCANKQHC